MSIRTVFVTFLFVASFLGCESAPESGSDLRDVEPAEPATAKPVLVMMGGFNSCQSNAEGMTPEGQGLDEPSRRLEAEIDGVIRANVLRRDPTDNPADYTDPRWVLSCYDQSGNLYVKSAHGGPSVVKSTGYDLRPLVDAILGEERVFFPNPVYIIAHSHGGWTAMKTILQLDAGVKVAGLYTIDPISYMNCSPTTYATAVAMVVASPALAAAVNPLSGCQEAPSDITNAERARIASRVAPSHWKHYYQTNFTPLHSSEFSGDAQPSASFDVSSFLSVFPSGAAPAVNAHTGIHQLTSIWYSVGVMIKQDLGAP